MRTIVVTELVTLDGIVDSPGGGDHPHGGWSLKDVEFDEAAYDIKGRETEQASALPKYVVSTTLDGDTVPWGDSEVHVLRSLDDVAALKETDGGEIHVHGSPTLAQGLAAAGLVDRYHLLVFPVLLGSGKRLFVDGTALDTTKLALTEHASYSNGITLQVYDVVR